MPSRRRRRRRRIAIGALAVVLVLVGVAAYGYENLSGKIHTFDASGLAKKRPAESAGSAENLLLIGSDARGGQNSKLGGRGGVVGRSDTTLLVHVYPGRKSAVAVSIPRDTLVTIPACRLPDGSWTQPTADAMFNGAFTVGLTRAGNPACTVNTVEHMSGLRIDHTVVVNFAGFAAMSRAIGGVPVCLPHPVYQGDLNPNLGYQGKVVFPAGRQRVEGARALQYVRVRHGLGDGSDIGRINRQQAFLSSMISTIRRQGLAPNHILPLVDAATKNMTFDPGLSNPAKLFSFAMSLRHLSPAHIDFITMPWRYDGARVSIVQPAANDLWSALRHNRPIDGSSQNAHHGHAVHRPRGSGAVDVLNGTWTTGIAGDMAARLNNMGFTATAGNAASRGYSHSEILYPPADAARAKLLAEYVHAHLVPDANAHTVLLVLGASHHWRAAPRAKAHRASLPADLTGGIRKATANICSHLTYG